MFFFLYVRVLMYNRLSGKLFFSQRDRRLVKKFKYSPNRSRTYEVLVTGPDALLLSYRRLVGAKASKLGSCDKYSTYC